MCIESMHDIVNGAHHTLSATPEGSSIHAKALCLRFAFFCCVCTVLITIQCTRIAKVDMNATRLVEKILWWAYRRNN